MTLYILTTDGGQEIATRSENIADNIMDRFDDINHITETDEPQYP